MLINRSFTLNKAAKSKPKARISWTAPIHNPPYARRESFLSQAFPNMPRHAVPTALQGPRDQRIYELRSYEGPTEKYFANKVRMFNEGGEVPLFSDWALMPSFMQLS